MKKRLFGSANFNKKVSNTPLPRWFPEIERIDWDQYDYIYSDTVDVISIFRLILTANPSIAIQSCIRLNREITHQDINEIVASAVIPFYLKILNEDSLSPETLETVAASVSMLTDNIVWIIEKFERQDEPKSFDFLNPGYPRIPSEDEEFYNEQSLVLDTLWQSYLSFLQSTQSGKSNLYKVHIIELMVSLIVCRRAKSPESETPFYKETCAAIFDFLRITTCDERKKTEVVSAVMKLARYDHTLILRLRDWGKEWADFIWVPRTVAFEIAEFENGAYATSEEIALRKTLSRCGLWNNSKYLPAAESAEIWREWHKQITRYETAVHTIPILKRILKPPY